MARPTTFVGSSVALFLEGTPAGTYTRPCGLTNHTFTFTKNATDVTVPDCADPELPAWIERGVESLDFGGSGTGVLAAEAVDTWWEAFNSTESINARIYVGKPTDTANGRYWQGKVHVTSFEVTGERGNKAQVSVSVVSDGELTLETVTV
ncbi:phage tail tube protein [Paracoccus sp. ME4]|uniref:phage tail tube protein n=1 Tax=Paracoccus sp. ME4 TaxID=3138066 RepID=UPI00398A8EEF